MAAGNSSNTPKHGLPCDSWCGDDRCLKTGALICAATKSAPSEKATASPYDLNGLKEYPGE